MDVFTGGALQTESAQTQSEGIRTDVRYVSGEEVVCRWLDDTNVLLPQGFYVLRAGSVSSSVLAVVGVDTVSV